MFYRCANKKGYSCKAPENVKDGSESWAGTCPLPPASCGHCEHPDAWLKGRTAPVGTYREVRNIRANIDPRLQPCSNGEYRMFELSED
jgi:hypothetical protein